jgi:hypothetical protein
MSLQRANLVFTIVGCALAAAVGCQAPLTMPFSRQDAPRPAAVATSTPPAVRLPNPVEGSPESAKADMASVLDKLEQVRALDPAAEQKLRDQLRKTPSDQWPLVAEQFRASLAFHQQLVANEPNKLAAGGPVTGYESDMFSNTSNGVLPRAAASMPMRQSLAKSNDRLSTPIGSLVDPHRANLDPIDVLAQAMSNPLPSAAGNAVSPPSEPPAPAEFAAIGPTYPIAGRVAAVVKPAAFEVPAAGIVHAATQTAHAKSEDGTAKNQSFAPDLGPSVDSSMQSATASGRADENWLRLVQKAADDLSRRVVPSPATTAEVHQHVSLRMLRLLAGDTEKALEPIPHISPAEQDYWSRQIFALATYLDHHSQPDDKRRAAVSVAHLEEAVSNLRELGSLSLRNLSFCKNVYGYGSIESYDTDTFTAGQQVSLYVEVENYHSKSTEKGYCTLLGATYELLDDKGKRVSGGDFPDVDDACRSRRRDFHIQYGLSLPENLTPGRYRVELVVKDRQSDKLGHATAPFEIRGGKKK